MNTPSISSQFTRAPASGVRAAHGNDAIGYRILRDVAINLPGKDTTLPNEGCTIVTCCAGDG